VPSEKRARQRAAREQKQAIIEKGKKRRRNTRRGVSFVILAALIVLIVFLVNGTGKKNASTTTSTSTSSSTSTSTTTTIPPTTFPTPTTQPLTTIAAKPACPPATGSSKRVVWFTTAPPACIARSSTYDATFTTSLGKIVVRMRAASSFKAVNNFVFLARYQYFNGTFFHRVLIGFVVQGGDPTGTGTGGAGTGTGGKLKYGYPGYEYTGNTPPSSCKTKPDQATCYQAGDLVLANSAGAATDSSQFFFILPGGQTILNKEPNYTLFGRVISGMGVVDKIGALGVPISSATGAPKVKVYLLSVTVKKSSG
jgi:cyclophilin family peptidyl-prolyl cis-trans isomerase/predicted nucleic acid-binding Zn ribbon protein